jgi:hypothetical protein
MFNSSCFDDQIFREIKQRLSCGFRGSLIVWTLDPFIILGNSVATPDIRSNNGPYFVAPNQWGKEEGRAPDAALAGGFSSKSPYSPCTRPFQLIDLSLFEQVGRLGRFKSLARNSRPPHTEAMPKSNTNRMTSLRSAGCKSSEWTPECGSFQADNGSGSIIDCCVPLNKLNRSAKWRAGMFATSGLAEGLWFCDAFTFRANTRYCSASSMKVFLSSARFANKALRSHCSAFSANLWDLADSAGWSFDQPHVTSRPRVFASARQKTVSSSKVAYLNILAPAITTNVMSGSAEKNKVKSIANFAIARLQLL